MSVYENDLQNLLIQKTEEILNIDLQEFQKYASIKTNFDQKLAQIIIDKYAKQSNRKMERQKSIPLTRSNFSALTQEVIIVCSSFSFY